MNGRKKYKGELYSFFRSERNIGSGGNGAVYDVEFEGDEGFEFPIVAKFFEYGGVDKEKRYNRFKNEIIALNALKGIEGIMEVIDKQCPHVVPQTKDEAWYLMPKAKPYKLNRKRNIYSSSVISLELNDISLVDEGYIAYSAAGHGFGNEYPRVYFSSGEKIIIKRKENL